ncbi:MAG: hypothetical protein AAF202_07815 [Pseudomonadota bacterium]
MILDFDTREHWANLSAQLTKTFVDEGSDITVKPYMGLYHGLAELTRGMARQFPTKKEILYLKDFDPTVDPHVMALAREGYKVTAVTEAELAGAESIVEGLGRETLCFVLSMDDPVFGLKSKSEKLLELLREKKVFTILVSHNSHFYSEPPTELLRTEAQLHTVSSGLTLGFLGARYKFAPFLAEGLPWPDIDFDLLKSKYCQKLETEKVATLEAEPIAGSESVFSERDRVKDRALLFWRDLDGHALIALLAEKLQIHLKPPRDGGELDTLSLSRWGGVLTMKWAERAFGLNPSASQRIRHDSSVSTEPACRFKRKARRVRFGNS